MVQGCFGCSSPDRSRIEAFAHQQGITPNNVNVNHSMASTKFKIGVWAIAIFSGSVFAGGVILFAIGVIPTGGAAAMMAVGGIILFLDLVVIGLLSRSYQKLIERVNEFLCENPNPGPNLFKEGSHGSYIALPVEGSSLSVYVVKTDNRLNIFYLNPGRITEIQTKAHQL